MSNGLFTAAAQVQSVCEAAGLDFCFIGGLAVLRWGEPRLTRDVDLTVLAAYGEEERAVTPLLRGLSPRIADADRFARRNRVVLLRASNGVSVDVALGGLDFEVRSVERATPWVVPDAPPLRTCDADDLIVHKVFAGRAQDWLDVEGVIVRHGSRLDVARILDEIGPLLMAKDDTDSLARVRDLLARPES